MPKPWLLARKQSVGDSRKKLETLGFTILDERDNLFYEVAPPDLWRVQVDPGGSYIGFYDEENKLRFSQLFRMGLTEHKARILFEPDPD